MIKTHFGFYELIWLSEKQIVISQVIWGKGNKKDDQGTWSMCARFSIKSFGFSDIKFSHKTWSLTSRNRCCDIQNRYRTILERSLAIVVPRLKGTAILEKTVLVICKIYDVILCMSKVEREHKAPARHLTFWHLSSAVYPLPV